MTKPIARDPMYLKRIFDADIIELCVRWYITYRLSYRDLVEMMAERGVKVAHSSRFSKAVGTSWRVDETYISIKAKWHYLYRAVDKHGKTVDFLLRRDRGITAAQAFNLHVASVGQASRAQQKADSDTAHGDESGDRERRELCAGVATAKSGRRSDPPKVRAIAVNHPAAHAASGSL
jgi:hypothetical protein